LEEFAMTEGEGTLRRAAGEARQTRSKAELALAKGQARFELRQIFDEEIKERAAEQARTLSRPATASQS
jgi:hypothetical protein